MRWGLSAAIGALAVLVGLAVSFQQELAALVPGSWVVVLLVAIVAGIQTVSAALSRRRTPLEEAETGDPERRYEAPVPGDELIETLRYARNRSRAGDRPRDRIRERVADAAVAAVADAEGCSEEAARDRIRAGEWTDDAVAAWFLGEEVGLPANERARLLASAPFSQFEAAFDRAVRAVDAVERGGGR